jgi:DNA-binding XRE family transcriptional regulator
MAGRDLTISHSARPEHTEGRCFPFQGFEAPALFLCAVDMTRGHRLTTLKARREAAGISVPELARLASCSDQTIVQLEAGGNCDPDVTDRIITALGASVAITSSSVANPSQLTTAANTFRTNDTVTIAGHSGSTPTINGDRVATVVDGTHFTIPVNVTGGGTGGTAVLSPTTIGKVAL